MAIDSSKMTYNKNKPTYSSKNDKTIASKLAGALKSKGYVYNGNAERQLSLGDFRRAEQAGTDTINTALKINQGDTYSGKVSNQLLHKYRSGFLAQNREGLNKLDFSNYSTYRQNKFDALNKLAQKESTEYSRYRDKVSDWQNDRSIALEYEYLNKKQNEAAAKAQAKADAAAAKEAAKAEKEAAKASKTKKSTGSKRSGTSSTYDDSDISTTNTANTTQNTNQYPYGSYRAQYEMLKAQNQAASQVSDFKTNTKNQTTTDNTQTGRTFTRTDGKVVKVNPYQQTYIATDPSTFKTTSYQYAYDDRDTKTGTSIRQQTQENPTEATNTLLNRKAYLQNLSENLQSTRRTGQLSNNALQSNKNMLSDVTEELNLIDEQIDESTYEKLRKKYAGKTADELDSEIKKLDKVVEQKTERNPGIAITNKLTGTALNLTNKLFGGGDKEKALDVEQAEREARIAKKYQWDLRQFENSELIDNDEKVKAVIDAIPFDAANSKMGVASNLQATVDKAKTNAVSKLNEMGLNGESIVDTAQRNYNDAQAGVESEWWANLTKAGFGQGLFTNEMAALGSVAGTAGALQYGLDYAKYKATGEYNPIDYNKGPFKALQIKDAVTRESNKSAEKWGEAKARKISNSISKMITDDPQMQKKYANDGSKTAGQVAAFCYDAAFSMLENLNQRALFKGGASKYTMAASAAASKAMELANEGVPEDQIAKTAALNAFGAWFSETAELELLDGMKAEMLPYSEIGKMFEEKGLKEVVKTVGGIVGKNAAKSAANEGAGEGLEYAIEEYGDYLINGGYSDYCQKVDEAQYQGYSREEAKQIANSQMTEEFANSVLAGALTGAVSSVAASARGAVENEHNINQVGRAYKNDVDKVIEAGLDMREGTKSNETANKLLAKFAEDEKITNREVGQLVNTVVEETTAQKNEAIEVLGSALENKNTITSDTATKILNNDAAIEVVNAVTGSEITADSSVKEVQKAVRALQSSAYEGSQNTDTNTNARQSNSALINLTNDASGVAYKGATVDVLGDEYKLSGNTTVAKGGIRKVGVIVDGKEGWVDADNVVAKDKNVGKIIENSYAFGKNGRAAFLTNFTGDTGADAYSQAFKDYYVAGLTGQSLESVVSDYGEVLPDTVKFNAWASGQNDESASLEKKEVNVAKARVETAKNENASNVGKVVKNANTNIDEATENALNGIANILNREIRFIDNDDYNGKLEDGVIYISNTSENPIMAVISHEITHYGEVADPKGYADYKNTVINGLKKYDIDRYNRYADEIRKRYLAQDKAFSEKMLLDEIVANATEAFVAKPTDFQNVVNQNPTFGNKIAKFLNNFISWFEEQSYDVEDDAAKMLTEDVELFKEAAVKWQRMVELASAVDTKDSSTRYSNKKMNANWTINNGILAEDELADFYNKWSDIKAGKNNQFSKDSKGNYMLPIGNKIVYTNGRYSNPSINRVDSVYVNGTSRIVCDSIESFIMEDIIDYERKQELTGEQFELLRSTYEEAVKKSRDGEVNIYRNYRGDYEVVQEYERGRKSKVLSESYENPGNESSGKRTFGTSKKNSIIKDSTSKESAIFNEENDSDDVRFSLKKPVEQTKDLIAVHNLSESKLMDTLNLGGFPMPSIAITKGGNNHNQFGKISVLFGKDTIDPSNKDNKVYSADAWTPTFPTVSTEVITDALWDINDKLDEIVDRNIANDLRGYNIDSSNTPDKLDRWGTVYEAYKDNVALMYAYMKDTGKDIELPLEEAKLSKQIENGAVKELAKDFTRDEIEKIRMYSLETYKNNPEVAENYRNVINDYYKRTADIDELYDVPLTYSEFEDFSVAINKYLRDGIRSQVNYYDAQKLLKNSVDQEGFENWINQLFKKAIGRKGIRNNKYIFTASGNRRSWNALHDELTLEGVIKNMKSQKATGGGIFGSSLTGSSAREFKSIDDIKKDSGRIKADADQIIDEMRTEFTNRFDEILNSVLKSDDFMHRSDAREILLEAVQKSKTLDGVRRYLNSNKQWINVHEDTADDLYNLVSEIAKMPTDYFEAKPRRAVGFDEIKTVVIPNDSSQELIDALESNNIPYEVYESGNNKQRAELLNAHEDARFSLKKGNNLDMNAEDDAMTPTSNLAQETMDLLKGYEITQTQIKAMFDKEVLKNNSDYSEEEFNKKISNIAAYLNGNYRKNAKMVMSTLQDVAYNIMESAKEEDTAFIESIKPVKDDLRKRTIVLNQKQLDEVVKNYGSFADFRRAYLGKADFRTEDSYKKWYKQKNGTDISDEQLRQKMLDANWDELSSMYPDWFSKDTNEGDQVAAYVDAIDAMNDNRFNGFVESYGYGTSNEMARSLANDMFADLMSAVSPVDNTKKWNKLRTLFAERNKAYKELLTQRYEEKFQKLKNRYENRNNRVLEQMAKQRDSYKERAAKQRENAERAKIKSDARKIYDSMNKMLTDPTESKFIPYDMVNDCIDILEQLNFDSGWRRPDGTPTQAYIKLDEMKKSYENLRASGDDSKKGVATYYLDSIGAEYDRMIPEIIDNMKELFKDNKKIGDLSNLELKEVLDSLSYINESVKKSTQFIGNLRGQKTYKAANKINEDIMASGGVKNDALSSVEFAMLSPERAVRKMVGHKDDSLLSVLTKSLVDGEVKEHQARMQGQKMLDVFMKGKENEKGLKRITGSKAELHDYGIVDTKGNPVKITKAMAISLYLHSQNESNMNHINGGGYSVPNMELYKKGKLTKAYNDGVMVKGLSKETLKKIKDSFDDYDWTVINASKDFFNDYSKKLVNETSKKLLGFEKARVKNYFPIKTDSDFVKKPFDSIAYDFSLENSGFTKNRQKGASNPIILEDVTSVLNRQLDSVAKYYGLAIPLSDFNKVMNVSFNGYDGSLTKTIRNKWHETGMKYIENMIADLNDARAKADPDAMSKVLAYARGNIASYALVGNIVTTIKQAASYPTAAATLGYRALGDALAKSGQYISSEKRASKQALIDKYTPEHWIRRQGSAAYGTDLETIGSQNDILTKVKNVPVLGVLANSIQEVDIGTTFLLWDAAEANVSKNYNYEKGSDSYYRKVAEVYNKAIHDTQPNYSVMQRPDILRSKNEVTKGFTMFMTQRLQNGNIILDSTANLRAKELAYKNAKTDENKAKLTEARNEFAHAISSQVISLLVLNAMTLLGGALHHKMKRYKDKDGDITFESLMGRYVNDCFAAAAGSFLFGGEIYDFIQAQITGEKYYGISDNSISTISSIADSLDKSVSAVQKMWDEGMDSKEAQAKLTKAMWSTTKSISQLFGIPVNNVANVINGVRYHVEDAMNGEFGSFEAGEERTTTTLNDKYYDAIVSGDEDAKAHWYAELRDAGKDDKQIATEVRKHLKENQDVIDAADALNSHNYMAYDSLVNGLVNQGFSKEDVLQTVNNVAKSATDTVSANAIETSDFSDVEYDGGEIETVDAPEAKGDGSTKSMYTQDMLKYALDNGDSTYADQIVEDLKNAKYNSAISKGKTAEEAEEASNKAITSMVKGAYKDEFAKAFMDGDSTTTKKIAGILEGYGFDGNDFRSMVSDEVKDNFLEAYENGTDSELEKAMSKAEEAGYDESTVRGWVGLKDKYVEAYESGNTAEANKIAEKAYKLGYSEDAVLKWVGRTQYSDITDAADSVLKLAGSGNYSTNDMVKARDERIAELMAEGKTEQEARSSLKTAMTNYYHPIYVEASAEDRARIRNILDGYFWYGQGAKKKTNYWTAKKLEEWANWTSKEKEDEEEEKSTNLKAYW